MGNAAKQDDPMQLLLRKIDAAYAAQQEEAAAAEKYKELRDEVLALYRTLVEPGAIVQAKHGEAQAVFKKTRVLKPEVLRDHVTFDAFMALVTVPLGKAEAALGTETVEALVDTIVSDDLSLSISERGKHKE